MGLGPCMVGVVPARLATPVLRQLGAVGQPPVSVLQQDARCRPMGLAPIRPPTARRSLGHKGVFSWPPRKDWSWPELHGGPLEEICCLRGWYRKALVSLLDVLQSLDRGSVNGHLRTALTCIAEELI